MYFHCIPYMIGKYLVGIKKDLKFRLSFVIFLYFLCILPKAYGHFFSKDIWPKSMWIIWSQIGFNSIFSQFSPCVIVYQYLVRVTHFLGDFGQKEVFLWSKTVLFGQEVHTISPCVVVYWYLVPKSLNCKLHFIILYFVHCWSIFGLKIFGRNMFGRVEVSYLKANSHSIFILFSR